MQAGEEIALSFRFIMELSILIDLWDTVKFYQYNIDGFGGNKKIYSVYKKALIMVYIMTIILHLYHLLGKFSDNQFQIP